ncbi:type VI secretion system protein ImpK [Salinibacter ruber]|uniref:type IVB secretion system protein IcmH/DotU n=1 Tax=Salinibacter ruber TaxID=146919 RepID=UPI0016143476|nr:type IVB secretion system protein IcmH/DotU [Salinibacter ruber]MBB4070215.1 type VI secretion system protein ImpK [Salinibacter ruber]
MPSETPTETRDSPDQGVLFDETADQRLSEIFAPCFTLILNMRASDDFGDPESLRRRIKELLDDAEREALRVGASPDDIQSAKFALVAFIDETILSSDWARKEEWASTPLQLELYDQYDAGEVFFDRLERLREEPGAQAEVLEVYYLCMTLGFKGKYQIHGQERLRELIETTYEDLRHQPGMGGKELAPHGAPRGQVAQEMRSKLPTWVIAAAAALIGLLIYTGMYFYASSAADDTAREIQSLTTMTP